VPVKSISMIYISQILKQSSATNMTNSTTFVSFSDTFVTFSGDFNLKSEKWLMRFDFASNPIF
jgi:hypothetical protein